MPEFAEVNYQVKWLRARVTGWKIDAYGYTGTANFPELKADPQKDTVLKNFFTGATLKAVTQRGKFVVMRLSSGTLIAHLMFTGRWSLAGEDFVSNYKKHKEPPTAKSNNFWMVSAKGRLNFHEPEYKGKVHIFPGVLPGQCEDLRELGPEVLVTPMTDPDFARTPWDLAAFQAHCARTKTPIKALLLDQKKQAGIGNMYACESLYRAAIDPARPASALSPAEAARLHDRVQAVIRQAIETELDYDKVLAVYKRETDPAGHAVQCTEVGGRDTYWVPAVQK